MGVGYKADGTTQVAVVVTNAGNYDFDGNGVQTNDEQAVRFTVPAEVVKVKFTYGVDSTVPVGITIGIDNQNPRPEFRIAITDAGGVVQAMDASDRPDLYILAAGSGTAALDVQQVAAGAKKKKKEQEKITKKRKRDKSKTKK